MKFIDNFLNGITMYRLVLFGLSFLTLLALVLSLFEILPYKPLNLIYSLLTLLAVCFVTNELFTRVLKIPANVESVWITAFILFFILYPLSSISDLKWFALTGFIAMASKYLLAIKKKHLFNPVAVSLVIMGLFGFASATWWVGSSVMLIPVIILGFLILRKTRRFEMFFSFVGASLVSLLIFNYFGTASLLESLVGLIVSGPLLFFGSVMLTEPLTTPPNKKMQVTYGLLVGAFFSSQFSFGVIYSTPELALIIGNVFSYFVSPRFRLVLTLEEKNKLSADVWEFVWRMDRKINFKSGQYLEWTLGHDNPDMRGNRRFFTIASSPTESFLKLGVKSYENSSSFKKKLFSLNIGDRVVASQLAGEFTLPEDKLKKLVFIAGGIGVTPFRSMVQNLLDTNDKRDVTLFFSNKTPQDIVYKNIFDEAKISLGMKTIYTVNDLAGAVQTEDLRVGFINAEMIMKEVPDYKDCIFYISGPHGMVTAFEDVLSKLGIAQKNIKTDFFPGFV